MTEAVPPFITGAEVKRLVDLKDVIEAVGEALKQFSAGEEGGVVQPPRNVLSIKDHGGFLLTKPAYAQKAGSLAVKLITLYSGNGDKGLPSHQGIIVLFNAATGAAQAVYNGCSGIDMHADSSCFCMCSQGSSPIPPAVLCVVGTGDEARSHLRACMIVHQYREVRVWGRNKEKARKCADDVGGNVLVFESLEEAVRGADVIVTVTLSKEPLVRGAWVKTGAVLCCVGAVRPDWRELDDEFMQNALVTADCRETTSREAGDIVLSKAEIYAEIGEIMSGSKPLPKVPDCGKKYYLFKSQGLAVEDAVSAKLVYDQYLRQSKM